MKIQALADADAVAQAAAVFTASEAQVAVAARGRMFEQQTQEYRDSVLPPAVTARVAIEQASTFGWERYVGRSGRVIGMRTFGASVPLKALQEKFGFEPDRVAAAARQLLGRQ